MIEGAGQDDAEQVALIAIYEAWSNFDPDRGVPFEAFAADVAKKRLWDAATKSRRGKHRILTEAAGEIELMPILAPDPADVVEHRLELWAIVAALPTLTVAEREALTIVLNGTEYGGERVIDNAIQRMRRKLRSVLF